MTARGLVIATVVSAVLASSAGAQGAILSGLVSTDTLGKNRVAGAYVSITALSMTTRANYMGDYRLDGLAAGKYLVMVRADGYKTVAESVVVAVRGETFHDFVMTAEAVTLDPVVTTDKAPRRAYVSPMLRGFEERRAAGLGHFIPEAVLRKAEHQRVSEVISARFPGMKLLRTSTNAAYLVSTRFVNGCDAKLALGPCPKPPKGMPAMPTACFATIYLDGALVYDPKLNESTPPPNIDDYNVDQLGGIEFYGGEATAPQGFRITPCGLLLLWTRER
jgi:Carboxypeptidase regulatory-like domain